MFTRIEISSLFTLIKDDINRLDRQFKKCSELDVLQKEMITDKQQLYVSIMKKLQEDLLREDPVLGMPSRPAKKAKP